jgi:DNA-binding NarL/FixJ family response regulator
MGQTPWWERLGVPYAMVTEPIVQRRVLVVSNNAFLRRVIGDFLEQSAPTHVETRSSVEHALSQPIAELDLLIAEYAMPRESGLALLKEIRTGRTGFPPEVPFVVVLENAERWLIESAVQLDAGACLLMPLSAQKVEEATRLAMKREHVQPPQTYDIVEIAPPARSPVAAADAAPALAACFARALPGAGMVKVSELQRGMILGADLLSERNVILLVAGTPLDLAAIARLRHASDAFGFDQVPVVKPAEGGA